MAEPALEEPPVTEPAGRCPRCGAGVLSGQIACLECAAPLAPRRRRPGRTRVLAGTAAALLLIAGLGAGYAVSRVADDDEVTVAEARAGQPPPAPAAPPDSSVPTAPPPPAQAAPAPDAPAQNEPGASGGDQDGAPDPAEQNGAGGALENWPAGRDAYTVILLSSPDRAGAQARAREANRAGIDAGVLHSDDYPSLNPGYWVVFAGQYSSRREAQRQAERYAEQGFDGGYARYVKDE